MIAPIDMKNTSKTPVFVVGQPRSGSTILTRVLNDIPGLFIINDFYVLQKIDSNGLWKQLTCEQAHMIAGLDLPHHRNTRRAGSRKDA